MVPLEQKMEESRKLLNSFLPSIAELAARTAESLRQTKVEPQKPQVTETVEKAREDVERRAETLKEQLVDEANTQEMLTDEGRRKARNADISLQAIEQQMEAVKAAQSQLESAPEADKPEAAEQLNQAADAAAKTMDQIAQHYEQEASDAANSGVPRERKEPIVGATRKRSRSQSQAGSTVCSAQRAGERIGKRPAGIAEEATAGIGSQSADATRAGCDCRSNAARSPEGARTAS